MNVNTHLKINRDLCGKPIRVDKHFCRIEFKATQDMAADDMGLVHGGFVFGLADYAAMVAVNDPNVVLGSSTVKFLKPVKVDDILFADATVTRSDGKKHHVSVTVTRKEESVFQGEFTCFVLPKHVLAG